MGRTKNDHGLFSKAFTLLCSLKPAKNQKGFFAKWQMNSLQETLYFIHENIYRLPITVWEPEHPTDGPDYEQSKNARTS
jgi:hypothetical protein